MTSKIPKSKHIRNPLQTTDEPNRGVLDSSKKINKVPKRPSPTQDCITPQGKPILRHSLKDEERKKIINYIRIRLHQMYIQEIQEASVSSEMPKDLNYLQYLSKLGPKITENLAMEALSNNQIVNFGKAETSKTSLRAKIKNLFSIRRICHPEKEYWLVKNYKVIKPLESSFDIQCSCQNEVNQEHQHQLSQAKTPADIINQFTPNEEQPLSPEETMQDCKKFSKYFEQYEGSLCLSQESWVDSTHF